MYGIVKQNSGSMGPNRVCSVLGVSRKGYDKWLQRKPAQDPFEMKVRNEMQKIALEFPRYGYRRMTEALKRMEFEVNRKRVLRLMRQDNLLCTKRLFKPVTTNSSHSFKIYPNLAKGMKVTGLNQLWVSDITYIRLPQEFIYLAAIIDVFSRMCIGWELDRSLDAQFTVNALHMALKARKRMDLSGLVHHSDQGVQYASDEYVDILEEHGIRISMSRKANPYDNAFMESFIKTLKYEEVYLCEYESFNEAHANIKRFIEDVYNRKRLHSGIGYLPPEEFEKAVCLKRRKVKIKVIVS